MAATAAVLIAGAAMPTASAVNDKLQLGGGAALVLHDDVLCTLTAIGHDSAGRLIGFTAAHCGPTGSSVLVEGAEDHGPVGTVVATDEGLDYAVLELDPAKVKPIGDYEGFGIFGMGPVEPEPAEPQTGDTQPAAADAPAPDPAAAEPAPAPEPVDAEPPAPEPPAAQQICKLGRGTGLNCYDLGPDGVDTAGEDWWKPGDDGAPVTVDNLIVGMVHDATVPAGPLDQLGPGIVMFKAILADLNAKGGPGAGFGLG